MAKQRSKCALGDAVNFRNGVWGTFNFVYTDDSFFAVLQVSTRSGAGCEGSHHYYQPPNECEATDAPPGTPKKIETLCQRLMNGQPLWHEDDATFDGHSGIQPRYERGEGRPDEMAPSGIQQFFHDAVGRFSALK